MTAPPITLTGSDLTIEGLLHAAASPQAVTVPAAAWDRVDRAHAALDAARGRGSVYGANTGVGANRATRVRDEEAGTHGLRLLRSHCAGLGPEAGDVHARATMVVRLNQVLAGGSGLSRPLAEGLLRALTSGAVPSLHTAGSIGTGDLAPLAELALTLIGERDWRTGTPPLVPLAAGDALPFLSSSALTVAAAAEAVSRATTLLAAAEVVAALSFLALRGSPEAWDDRVHRGRLHPQQRAVAQRLTGLVGTSTPSAVTPARLQDPYALRVVPQVHAPALQAVHDLRASVERELNAAVENPLVTGQGVLHHGQFHLATLAADLDRTRTVLVPALTLSASRVSLLMSPAMTGLAAFLSDGVAGSSGLMIAEYVGQDLLAQIRLHAGPVTGGGVSISLGLEEHASFAGLGARHLGLLLEQAEGILALEAVAAVRALRLAPGRRPACPAVAGFELLAAVLADDLADRPLDADAGAARGALPLLAAVGRRATEQRGSGLRGGEPARDPRDHEVELSRAERTEGSGDDDAGRAVAGDEDDHAYAHRPSTGGTRDRKAELDTGG